MLSSTEHREEREELLETSRIGSSKSADKWSLKSTIFLNPSLSTLTGSYSLHDSSSTTALSSDEEFSDSDDEEESVISDEAREEQIVDIRDTDTDIEVVANDHIFKNMLRQDGVKKKNKGSLKSISSLKKKLPKFFSKGKSDNFDPSNVRISSIDRYAVRSKRDKYCIEGMEDIDAFSFNSDMQGSRFSRPQIETKKINKEINGDGNSDFDYLAQWFSKNLDIDIMDQSKNISDYLSNQNFDFNITKTLEEAIEATTSESKYMYSDFISTLEDNLVSLQSAVDSVQQSLFTLNDTIENTESTLGADEPNNSKRDQAISEDDLDSADSLECKENFEIRQDDNESSLLVTKPKKVRFLISKLKKRIKKKFYRRKRISEERDQ